LVEASDPREADSEADCRAQAALRREPSTPTDAHPKLAENGMYPIDFNVDGGPQPRRFTLK
jgi:hypothetical protein